MKKKRRVYTEKELGIPTLNMITPVGVEKPKGGKKGKVFVDDRVCSPCPVILFWGCGFLVEIAPEREEKPVAKIKLTSNRNQ